MADVSNISLAVPSDDDLLAQLTADMALVTLPVSIIVATEAVLGFVGNLLVLYVFIFHYHECNFRYFVLSLALIDFISCMTTVPLEIVTQRYWYMYYWPAICKIKSFFNIYTVSAETFCLFVIAVDRYRKVCQPLRRQITPLMAKLLCLAIFLATIVLALPTPIFWGIHKSEKVYMNRTIEVTVCEKDEAYVDSQRPLQFIATVESVLSVFLVAMFTLYAFVAKQLVLAKRRSPSERMQSTNIRGSTVRMNIPMELPSNDLSAGMPAYIPPNLSSSEFGSTTASASRSTNSTSAETENGLQTKEPLMTALTDKHYNVCVYVDSSNDAYDSDDLTKVKCPTEKPDHPLARSSFFHSHTTRRARSDRVRTKTKIMLILTTFFILTCVLYLTMGEFIASGKLLDQMSDSGKAVYFTFLRFVFLNHMINPIIYGYLDAKFKKGVRRLVNTICRRN